MKKNDGQRTQDDFAKEHPNALRLIDYRASMVMPPAQPGDYVIPRVIIECKSTVDTHFEKKHFVKKQLAKQHVLWVNYKIPTVYFLQILRAGNRIVIQRYVPFKHIWKFFYTKGKGRFTYKNVRDTGFLDLKRAMEEEER